ncbi:MAG: alpha/beta hydrolase [Chloroflexi bacterium]|nr:alpha/beta hydrolase [Chloroflexota bacterium]
MRKFTVLLAAIAVVTVVAAVPARKFFRSREDTAWRDAERPGRIVTVDGVGLHYVEQAPPVGGNVPTIVMIHGFGGNTYSFRHQIVDLAQDYRCVAIDLKGFGYSERPDGGDYSLTAQARLVLGAMDALGVGKATLIGQSMGGEVVMRMAEMAPERVERIILAASVPGKKVPIVPRLSFMRRLVDPIARLVAERSWKRLFYDKNRPDLEQIRAEYQKPARIYGTMRTVWEMWEGIRHDERINFARLTQPVLILWAEKERILLLPGRSLRWLQAQLPHAVTEHIPLSGHMLLEEQPAIVNAAIRRFLDGARVGEAALVDAAEERA